MSDVKKKNKRQRGSNRNRQKTDNTSVKHNPLPKITLAEYTCPYCNKPINDLSAALSDKKTGVPVHFDCVLEFLKGAEDLKNGESLTYIGQGKFAVTVFPNSSDLRNFKIIRVIEWEDKNSCAEWRGEIAGLYSKV
ncbi:hypothetical protein DWQ65_12240 [Treponema phagedenis]|uniref:Uncharacterized protein n=1 Tax=Treponema phagedenis TaxID=162 RepID=A0A0B7GYN6_TREPH|nr:hypothetical protein [Treponema phagedenis]EFW38115.1 hypothetical protein HMPREF9554_01390 [Treponema phagedenis F0421]NVP23436.1 hypothetical protein [Treponema phagedenis]QEJ95652.1 hypothetical protein FUT79_10840 [Treponema phagedenis]QEJ98577.1 hypothetical protein FUT82_11610 [Treponema phagedenis]QEK01510.1 hypothetical protein FUT84_10330 [Treponema phagedenis]